MLLNKFNLKLLTLLAIIHIAAIFLVPLVLFFTQSAWAVIIFLPSLLLTHTTWALIHEGIHNNFSSNSQKNLFYSRMLAMVFHLNFETLKFGHLQHHRYNRQDCDLTDGYDSLIKNKFIIFYKNLFYYLHISIGLYIFELLGPLVLLLPQKLVLLILDKILGADHPYIKNGKILLLKPKRLKNIKIDNIINISLLIIITALYSYSNFLWLYLVFLLIRGLLISSTDNLPHYGACLDNIKGAYNLKAPLWWQKMILNFNYHRIHHKYPNLPWHLLPIKYNEDQDYFDHHYFRIYLQQWWGIISKDQLNKN
ncbi:MAG: fatty acid desaturase [Gammaproteobacteria bacterium]|nr:fatty acid desaturase [Gammaproteobacteria bacterium]